MAKPADRIPLERLIEIAPTKSIAHDTERDQRTEEQFAEEVEALAQVLGPGLWPDGPKDQRLLHELLRRLREREALRYSVPLDSSWRDIADRIEE